MADIVAMLWGTDGQEINPLYDILNTAFNYPDKNSSLIKELTDIVNDILYLKYSFDEKEKFAAENIIFAISDVLNPEVDFRKNVLEYYYNSLTPDIDESIETAIPAIKNILIKPEYRAFKLISLLGAALTRVEGRVSFIDYIDRTSNYFRPRFDEEVSELFKLALPSLRILSRYFTEYDTYGELMNLIGFAISCGAVNDALNILAGTHRYDPDYVFLDFLKRFNDKNGVAVLADMIDAVHQYGIVDETIEVFRLLFKYDAVNEIIQFLYYFLPQIDLGEE